MQAAPRRAPVDNVKSLSHPLLAHRGSATLHPHPRPELAVTAGATLPFHARELLREGLPRFRVTWTENADVSRTSVYLVRACVRCFPRSLESNTIFFIVSHKYFDATHNKTVFQINNRFIEFCLSCKIRLGCRSINVLYYENYVNFR